MGSQISSNNYNTWIYCTTCNMRILMDVDTERHYGMINHLAKKDKTVSIPIEWAHITQNNLLNHVHSVEYNGTDYKYNQDTISI